MFFVRASYAHGPIFEFFLNNVLKENLCAKRRQGSTSGRYVVFSRSSKLVSKGVRSRRGLNEEFSKATKSLPNAILASMTSCARSFEDGTRGETFVTSCVRLSTALPDNDLTPNPLKIRFVLHHAHMVYAARRHLIPQTIKNVKSEHIYANKQNDSKFEICCMGGNRVFWGSVGEG